MFPSKYYLGSFALLICNSVYGSMAYQKAFYDDNPLKHVRNYHQAGGNRSAKYLFPFALINFAPEPCAPNNKQDNEGVCLSRQQCSRSGGEAMGSCQQGLGTCCRFTKQCTATMRAVTVVETVENLDNSNTAGSCEFVFPKKAGICQVRLEFSMLTLQDAQSTGPNAGNCQSESLTVSGAANIAGTLKVCGRLSGEHMILSYGAVSDMISVLIQSETAGSTYKIRATQIPCASSNKVPDDCLQYYDSTSAAIKSFGFPIQLNNQRYTICVRPTSGENTLTWDKCTATDAPTTPAAQRFQVSVQPPANKPDCLTDYIVLDDRRICGQQFPPLTTPLGGTYARMRVNFDENETGNDVFYVTIPSDQIGGPNDYCHTGTGNYDNIGLNPVMNDLNPGNIVPPFDTNTQPFCMRVTVDTMPMCMCRFSSSRDTSALAFRLKYVVGDTPGIYMCPKINGFIADPETPSLKDNDVNFCFYYANVRVTDTEDTGFCLRYTAT